MYEHDFEIIDAYEQDTGSQLFVLLDMRAKAEAAGLDPLVPFIDEAIDNCNETRSREFDWNQAKVSGPVRRREAVQIDVKIDRTLGQIHTIIETYAETEVESPQRQAARTLKKHVLPRGVFPITSLKYEAQHAAVGEFIDRCDNEFPDQINTLGLTGLLTTTRELNDDFGRLLAIHDDQITFDEVLAARSTAEASYARVLMAVMVETFGQPELRQDLLSAFKDQQARIANYRKRRGASPTIDPDTGEPIDAQDPVKDDVVEPVPVAE